MSAVEIDFFDTVELYSNWKDRAVSAYDENNSPNFLDEHGDIVEGIYLDLPNDVYHSLPAISSSKLKDFIKSPALYFRNYLSGIERKRTQALQNTFDAGTHGHTLILEPQGFYSMYFRDLMPSDLPEAIHTAVEMEVKLVELGLKKSGTKSEKAKRLYDADPNIKIFEIERTLHLESQGAKGVTLWDGEEVVTYGGKIPVDGMVWDDAHRVEKTTRNHHEADAYFQNGLPEVAMFALCPQTKLMLKVKFDWLRFDDIAVDMKTTQSTMPEKFMRQINDLHYDVQQEFYKYVAHLQGVNIDEFVFVATEYVNMDACQPYALSSKRAKIAYNKVQNGLEQLVKCQSEDRWFGWVNDDCTLILE